MSKDYLPKLKPLINTHLQWQAFLDMLDEKIEMHQKKLEQSSDMVELYKAQGAIIALRNLKYLKDEIDGIR